MSDDHSARLALPYLAAGQMQKHVTLNEALTRLDALVQTAVVSRTTLTQPATPDDGALWILPAGANWQTFFAPLISPWSWSHTICHMHLNSANAQSFSLAASSSPMTQPTQYLLMNLFLKQIGSNYLLASLFPSACKW